MSRKLMVVVLGCVFALSLALVGCGGDNGEAAKKAFTGTWDLIEMEQNGEVTGQEDLETLKSLGLEVYVNLNEDGSAALVLFGEPMEGTWTAKSATEGTITLEGQEVKMTIADSKLKFEQSGSSLTFKKGEAKDTPSATSASTTGSASAESASASAESASASAESASAEAASGSASSASA